MVRNFSIAAVMVLALATFAACSGGGGGTTTPNLNLGALGGPCLEDGTCNEGLVCNTETKICELAGPAAGAEGGACLAEDVCNEGLVCTNDICVKPTPGEECQNDSDCSGDLACIDGACTAVKLQVVMPPNIKERKLNLTIVQCPTGNKGCACFAGNTCSGDLVCKDDVCAEGPAAGEAGGKCLAGNTCSGQLICKGDVCQTCQVNADCGSGNVCTEGACVALHFKDPIPVGPLPRIDPSPMTSAKLTIITGDVRGAGTDAQVFFRLCKASSKPAKDDESREKWIQSNCTAPIDLDKQEGDNFEVGDTDVFSTAAGDFTVDGLTDEYKAFEINILFDDPGSDKWYNQPWLVQSIKLELTFKNGTTYTYFNPIWQRGVGWGDIFFPDDVVVGAIIGTGDVKNAGTGDKVTLRPKGDEGHPLALPAVYMECSYNVTIDACMERYIVEREYNDFERGMGTAYGVDVDAKPGTVPFRIEKGIDGKKGAWFLDSIELFHFEPGKFLNDPTSKVYHKKVEVKEWIENDLGLEYPRNNGWIQLDEASPDIITNEIGNHF